MIGSKKKVIGILAFLIILMGIVIFYILPIMSFGVTVVEMPEQLSGDTVLTAEQVEEDRSLAIEHIESIHPYFVLEKDLSAYETAKQNYIDTTASAMTVREFQVATAEYFCFFGDGHTRLYWAEEEQINLDTVYQDGKSYWMDDAADADIHEDIYIKEIGGVEIDAVYDVIRKVFPMENEMMEQMFLEAYIARRNILELAGVEIADDQVSVTFSNGKEEVYGFEAIKSAGSSKTLENTWYMDGDIFVVDFNTCVVDDTLEEITSKLKAKIKQGCSRVIVDARGNGGGNSNACKALLEAMDMTAPGYDTVIRFSKEAKAQNGYFLSNGVKKYKGSDKSVKNTGVELVVLSDRETFSSATMLCVWVRDGELGTIIGEPSSNMPNSYGDIIYFSLPNSHTYAWASHKQFIRPDESNDECMLIPDILTDEDEAYEEAVKYLQGK